MISVSITDYVSLVCFWLCFCRWLAILFQLPLFDNTAIPGIVKVLISLVVTYAFFPLTQKVVMAEIQSIGIENFWLLTMSHTIIGLLIGHLVKIIMSIFLSGAGLLSQQIGFGASRYFDPTLMQQVGPLEVLLQMTILMTILFSGALLPMFKGALLSFSSINLLDSTILKQSSDYYFFIFKSFFVSSIMLAAPMLVMNLILNLAMGVLSKAVPQMNIFSVSLVLNIGLGLFVFFAISSEYYLKSFNIYIEELGNWFKFVT